MFIILKEHRKTIKTLLYILNPVLAKIRLRGSIEINLMTI
jgi:hypothetical protein